MGRSGTVGKSRVGETGVAKVRFRILFKGMLVGGVPNPLRKGGGVLDKFETPGCGKGGGKRQGPMSDTGACGESLKMGWSGERLDIEGGGPTAVGKALGKLKGKLEKGVVGSHESAARAWAAALASASILALFSASSSASSTLSSSSVLALEFKGTFWPVRTRLVPCCNCCWAWICC